MEKIVCIMCEQAPATIAIDAKGGSGEHNWCEDCLRAAFFHALDADDVGEE